MADFLPAVKKTLKHEGGFVRFPKTGEVANRGITHWTLRALGRSPSHGKGTPRSVPATEAEIQCLKNLTEEDAIELYRENYWKPIRGDEIDDQALAGKVFDLQVNTGQGVRFLQRALNRINDSVPGALAEDNRMGPRTLLAVRKTDPAILLRELRRTAEHHYHSLAERAEHAGNLTGWLRRLNA